MTRTLLIRAGTGIGAGFTSVDQPRLSPDGTKVVFVTDTGIWVLTIAGLTLLQVSSLAQTGAGWPNWSPDGSQIVFGAAPGIYGNEVYIVNADGSGETVLAPALVDGTQTYWPSFAPDGTVIYSKAVPDGLGNFPGSLWTINDDGTGDTLFFTPPGPDEDSPFASQARWSHDGAFVFYLRSNTGADDGLRRLTSAATGDIFISEAGGVGADWSPDDSLILIAQVDGSTDLTTVDPDGADPTLLYDAVGLTEVLNPSYGPTDDRIVFKGEEPDAFNNQQLWLLDDSGPSPDDATVDCAEDPKVVTITGTGFGPDEGDLTIQNHDRDEVPFDLVSWSDTEIVVTIATDDFQNGDWRIVVNEAVLEVIMACDVPPPDPPSGDRRLIRRLRRFPLPFDRNLFFTIWRLEMLMQVGIGLRVGSDPPGQDPAVEVRLSTDAGDTWGPTMIVTAGRQGQRLARAVLNRLGHVQNGYLEISMADPVAWALFQAVIDAEESEP